MPSMNRLDWVAPPFSGGGKQRCRGFFPLLISPRFRTWLVFRLTAASMASNDVDTGALYVDDELQPDR